MLPGVEGDHDLGLVLVEGHEVVLHLGVLQPLQVLEGLGVRVVEHRIQLVVEHAAPAAVDLGGERRVEVGQAGVVLVNDGILHPSGFELEALAEHLIPVLGRGHTIVAQDLLVVLEGDQVGVVGKTVQLAVVGHVRQSVGGGLLLVLLDVGEVVF